VSRLLRDNRRVHRELPERAKLVRRFVEPRQSIAYAQPDDALLCFGPSFRRHVQQERPIRPSKKPFASDEFIHRLVIDYRVIAGRQKLHDGSGSRLFGP
jgi:hypothetical protein